MTTEAILTAVAEVCRDEPAVAAAYLLGSRAAGTARPGSDVDVALLPVRGMALDARARVALGTELSFRCGLEADIGVLSSRNLVYAREAVLKGLRAYAADPGYADFMEMTFLSMYGQYNDDRRELLHAFAV